MLKKKLNEFNDVFNKFDKEWAIVTAGDRNIGVNAMTVSWGGIGILWNKPVAFIFVRHNRHTFNFVEKSDSVSISFFDEKYRDELTKFGRVSGKDQDKFKDSPFHLTLDVDMNEYYIAEAKEVLKCKKIYSVDLTKDNIPEDVLNKSYKNEPIHRMYVLEIKQYLTNEE